MGTGTGKTLTSLFRVKENPTEKLLIICPHKVISQWEDVINQFDSNMSIMQFKSSDSAAKKNEKIIQLVQKSKVIIVNFEILHKLSNLKYVVNEDWTVIIDESHKIKELGTDKKPIKVTKAALELGRLTNYKIILTATPTQKEFGGYIDYYTQLKFLGYTDLSLREFKNKYCIEKQMYLPTTPFPIKKIVGYKNTQELETLLGLVAKRYTTTFGEFEAQHTKIRIERAPKYTKTAREMTYKDIMMDNVTRKRIALKTMTSGNIMGYNEFKEPFVYEDNTLKVDWLEEFLSNTDEVVAVFYQYNVELAILEKLLTKLGKKYIIINGKTKDKYRELKKDYDVVIGQYQAMSESLDGLQYKCHITVFYSLPESSLLYTQALGRIDRDGQTQVPMYYYLVMEKTIDDVIYTKIEEKVEFSEEILDKLLLKED